ncbi:MAG: APC family permease [Candidatus Hodarchaeota archaeon]
MSETKTYVRDATGLVREIGVITATIFILSNVIGGGWQYRVFQWGPGKAPVKPADYLIPGINPIIIAFILTGIGAIATVYVFAIMATAMPRAGGGYVYISRTISPAVGFATAWAEFLGIAISYGLIAVLCAEFAAWFLPKAGLEIELLSDQIVLTILGVLLIVGFSALAYFGTSMVGKVLHIMFWIPAVITLLIYVVLLMGALDPSLTEAGLKELTDGHTANELIQVAVNSGLTDAVKEDYVTGVFTAVAGAYWAWVGYAAISFAAGEVKESNRSLPIAHIAAGFIILFVYVTISLLMSWAANVGDVQGWTLFEAIGWIDWNSEAAAIPAADSWAETFAVMPFVAMLSGTGLGLGILNILFAIAGVLWLANDLPPFVTTSSRILFAMSFDRSLPEAFAKVDERWHSPTNAIIFTSLVACLGAFAEADFFGAEGIGRFLGDNPIPILSDFLNPAGGVIGTDLLDAAFFTTGCIAAILLPRRLKDVYERAPWKPKIAGYEGVVIIGWVALILNIYLDLILLGVVSIVLPVPVLGDIPFFPPLIPNLYPLLPEGDFGAPGGLIDFTGFQDGIAEGFAALNWLGWMVIGGIVTGLVIYFITKRYYSARGVDFSTIYASIPPE